MSATVKDIDMDIADILGQKYRYCIDIGNGDIDPPLVSCSVSLNVVWFSVFELAVHGQRTRRTDRRTDGV